MQEVNDTIRQQSTNNVFFMTKNCRRMQPNQPSRLSMSSIARGRLAKTKRLPTRRAPQSRNLNRLSCCPMMIGTDTDRVRQPILNNLYQTQHPHTTNPPKGSRHSTTPTKHNTPTRQTHPMDLGTQQPLPQYTYDKNTHITRHYTTIPTILHDNPHGTPTRRT